MATGGSVSILLKMNAAAAVAAMKQASSKIAANASAIGAAIKRIGGGMQALGSTMSRYVTLPIVAGLGLSFRAFLQNEQAAENLKTALATSGHEVERNFKRFDQLSTSLGKTTTIATAQSQELMRMALNFGFTADEVEGATKAAIGLARATGIDLTSALRAAALANAGEFMQLDRQLPQLRGITDKKEKLAALNRLVAQGMQQEEAYRKTAIGSMKQLKNEIEDIAASLGRELLPTVKILAERLRSAAEWFNGLSESQKRTFLNSLLVAAALGPVLRILGSIMVMAPNVIKFFGWLGTTNLAAGIKGMAVSLGVWVKGLAAAMATTLGFSSALSMLGVAAAAVGVAIMGWHLGKWIAEVTGLDKQMKQFYLNLGLFGNIDREKLKQTDAIEETKNLRAQAREAQERQAAEQGMTRDEYMARETERSKAAGAATGTAAGNLALGSATGGADGSEKPQLIAARAVWERATTSVNNKQATVSAPGMEGKQDETNSLLRGIDNRLRGGAAPSYG